VEFTFNMHRIQDSCFSPLQKALGSGTEFKVLCGKGRKKREVAPFFFCSRCFRFFHARFCSPSHVIFWLRACKCESAKMRVRRPLDIIHFKCKIVVHLCSSFTVQEVKTYFKNDQSLLIPEEELYRPPPGNIRQTPISCA
jgi:hypothetical protein